MKIPFGFLGSLLPNSFDFDIEKLFSKPDFNFKPDFSKKGYWIKILVALVIIFIISSFFYPLFNKLNPRDSGVFYLLLSGTLIAIYSLISATIAFLKTVERKPEIPRFVMFATAWLPTKYSLITSAILGLFQSIPILFFSISITPPNLMGIFSLFLVPPLFAIFITLTLGIIPYVLIMLPVGLRHMPMLNPILFAAIVKQIEKIFKPEDFEEKDKSQVLPKISTKEALTQSFDNALFYRHEHILESTKIKAIPLLRFILAWSFGTILFVLPLFYLPFDTFYVIGLTIGILPVVILFTPSIVRLTILKREVLREILLKARASKLEQGIGIKDLKQSFIIKRFWYFISAIFLIFLFVVYNFFPEGLENMLIVFFGSILLSFTVLYLFELSLFLIKIGKEPL